MKSQLISLHKMAAEHHGRLAKMHRDHAAALEAIDADDANVDFHRCAADEHADMTAYHKAQASAIAEDDSLPEPEDFDTSGRGKASLHQSDPRFSAKSYGANASAIAPPDPNDLEKRGLRPIPRFGQPTIEETLEQSASDLDPELRKAII